MLQTLSSETTWPSASQPRYQTIAPIGRGGMAEVILAVMTSAGGTSKLAVLKQIWPELAGDPHFVAMFLDEARLSVRMSHPNLVQTYEAIDDGQRLAIAMEYLDGQPLARVLNRLRGPQALTLPLRLRIVAKVLAGLDYAHELADYDGTPLAVVHRDVSPHNVFITYDGGVKLVDFGVAKNLANAHQTRPGALKGKFSYMAPEQFLGRSSDRRADIFAVGVMLWEMLAGRRFWSGASDGEIAANLMSDQPLPPLPAELGVPAAVEAICTRALQRDRKLRYATAAEMEAELEQVLAGARYAFERPLAKAVVTAFAAERAQRQLLVDHHLRQVRTGSYSPVGMTTDERGLPAIARSAMSRTMVTPPLPPPSRARRRAAAARRMLRSVIAGVAIAGPLAALIILIVGQSRTVSLPVAALPPAPPPRSSRLTNEPMVEEPRSAGRPSAIEPARIAPTVVELEPPYPPRVPSPASPPPRHHHRAGIADRTSADDSPSLFSRSFAPPPGPRIGLADTAPVRSRPRPIDVVNPFVVPPRAPVSVAPAR